MPTTKPRKRVTGPPKKKAVKKSTSKRTASKRATASATGSNTVPKKRATKKTVAPRTAKKKKSAPKNTKPSTKPKKTASKAVGGQALPRDLNEHGFVKGSESEKIADILLEGGASRSEIRERVRTSISKKTRHGTKPNVSSLIANVLRRLKEKGYTIESTWVLVPPSDTASDNGHKAKKRTSTKGTSKKNTAKRKVKAKS